MQDGEGTLSSSLVSSSSVTSGARAIRNLISSRRLEKWGTAKLFVMACATCWRSSEDGESNEFHSAHWRIGGPPSEGSTRTELPGAGSTKSELENSRISLASPIQDGALVLISSCASSSRVIAGFREIRYWINSSSDRLATSGTAGAFSMAWATSRSFSDDEANSEPQALHCRIGGPPFAGSTKKLTFLKPSDSCKVFRWPSITLLR